MNIQPTDQPATPQLLDAWTQFLGQWDWDWFCTLTFAEALHPESADKRFRLWLGWITRACADQGDGDGVRWVRALELQRREVIHYHVLLGGAGVDKLRRLSWMDAWSDLAGWARIERPRNATAVRRYAAKYTVKGGDVDVGGPGMHEPPASWWPRDWQTWPTIRKLDRVRQVVTDDEWQQLQRWSRAPRRPIPDTGWCEPGFSAEPAFLAEIPARLARRRGSGSGAPAAGVGSGRRSERGAQGELRVGGGRRPRSQPGAPLRIAQGPGGPPRRGERAQRA